MTIVDSTASAFSTSVTIGVDGLAIISYTGTFSLTGDNLSVVHCAAVDCSSYDAPIVLDNTSGAGEYGTSVAIGIDGFPITSYRSISEGFYNLSVVHCTAVDCRTHDPSTVVGSSGENSSLAIGTDGLPIITYAGYQGIFEFHVTHCSLADCSGENLVRILDLRENAGFFSSVTIGADGLPITSYYGGRFGTLDVIHCTLVDCSMQQGLISVPDSDPNAGAYPSVTIGTDGLPIISYEGAGGLSVVHCTNIDCSMHDPITVLDNTANSGQFTSIAIGADGLPIISYAGINDDGSTNLSTVHCGNVSCAP